MYEEHMMQERQTTITTMLGSPDILSYPSMSGRVFP